MTDVISSEIVKFQKILESNSFRLALPHDVEDLFKRRTEESRRRGLAIGSCVGLSIFDLLIYSDFMLLRDVFGLAVLFRFVVVTPLAIFVVCLTYRNKSPFIRELSQAMLCILAALGIVCLELLSGEPGRLYHHFELIQILLYAAIVQRLRFAFSLGLAAAICAMHFFLVLHLLELPAGSRLSLNFEVMACFVSIIFANYAGERWKRRQFLLTHLDSLRTLQMEHIAKFDTVTNLPNRRSLDEYISARQSAETAVILIDVDHFKRYNDFYGHPDGDRCLRAVGDVLARFRQDAGIVARYGGEEFILIVDGAKSSMALAMAETIRARVSGLGLPHDGHSRGAHVTVSVGFARGRAHTDHDVLRLIRCADEALYDAKAQGRNRVCSYRHGHDLDELSLAS